MVDEIVRTKIIDVLKQELDNPCNWCMNVGMDGKCMIDRIKCNYCLCDDVYETVADNIISLLPECTTKPHYQPTRWEAFQNRIWWKLVEIQDKTKENWISQKTLIQQILSKEKRYDTEEIMLLGVHTTLEIVNAIRGLERRKMIEKKKKDGKIMIRTL